MDSDGLTKLSRLLGIEDGYWDIKGQWHATPLLSSQTLIRILAHKQDGDIRGEDPCESSATRSCDPEDVLARLEVESKLKALKPVIVTEAGEGPFEIELRLADVVPEEPCSWCLSLEDGSEIRETINWSQCVIKERYTIASDAFSANTIASYRLSNKHDLNMRVVVVPIRTLVPEGYHSLSFYLADESGVQTVTTRLIAVPRRCYLPDAIQRGANVWGVGLQLYSLQSGRNWGIGDFGDIDELGKCLGERGASFIGLNPLHALPIRGESSCSPYSPVSRVAFNYLYLSLPNELDFQESDRVNRHVTSTAFLERLAFLRDSELVDYQGVADLKLGVLEMMFQSFQEKHISSRSPRAIEFEQYCKQKQDTLYSFALYQAIRESKIAVDVRAWGWPVWEEWFQSPVTEEVKQFAIENHERIAFFFYVQWLIEGQLGSLQAKLAEYGVEHGLYLDLALGVRRDSSDVWAHRELYLEGVDVGAPPDDINERGQNWGLPPMNPHELLLSKYQLFIDTIRSAMRYSGMIRIDHVMQLYRLFLIPEGCDGKEGLYLRYPLHDLMGIIALESQRNKCVVIGEDLGTVPDEVVREMRKRGVLSYNLFLFSRRGDGSFKKPDEYQEEALVAASTHDLPTITGYWLGSELRLRQKLGLYTREGELDEELSRRNRDRDFIKDAFQNLGLEDLCFDEGCSGDLSIELKKRLVRNVNNLLSKTPCYFQLVQLEDLVLQELQVNFPGTTDECPNWRRKIAIAIEEICRDEFVDTVAQVLGRRSC